jgi:hypothetical protein
VIERIPTAEDDRDGRLGVFASTVKASHGSEKAGAKTPGAQKTLEAYS